MAFQRHIEFNPLTPFAGLNPIDLRRDLVSRPIKELWKIAHPQDVLAGNPTVTTPHALLALYGALSAVTIAGNLGLPLKLIQMGVKGDSYFAGLTYAKNAIGFPMPSFNYITPGSSASKLGLKVGGKVGARVGARLIPGIGYGLLAFDVYDIAANSSLWGFDLS